MFTGHCFAQRTKDTLITGGVAVGSTEAIPQVSSNPIVDAIVKIVVGIVSAIAAQFVSDLRKKKRERKEEEKFVKSIGARKTEK